MKTQITCNSRLEVINLTLKLKKLGVSFVENEEGVLADITPENAWNLNLI